MNDVVSAVTDLNEYYNGDATRLATLRRIVNGQAAVSLRLLDWTCTNYVRVNPVDINGTSLHMAYQSQLSLYGKRLFDPFRRMYKMSAWGIDTSIGQLNFIKWAIDIGLIEWLSKNAEIVRRDIHAVSCERRRQPCMRNYKLTPVRPTASTTNVCITIDMS
jgi:hypothetical protein